MKSERIGEESNRLARAMDCGVSTVVENWRPMNPSLQKTSAKTREDYVEPGSVSVILIVDDDPMSRELLTDALDSREYRVIAVEDGMEGLRVLEDLRPAVMLVDIQMPYMDGFEFLTKVRETPRFATVPMVAVTAYAMVNDATRILKYGFDQYLSKPVPVKTLRQTIARLLDKSVNPAN